VQQGRLGRRNQIRAGTAGERRYCLEGEDRCKAGSTELYPSGGKMLRRESGEESSRVNLAHWEGVQIKGPS